MAGPEEVSNLRTRSPRMAHGGDTGPTALEERLKTDLRRTLRSRDRAAVAALRTAVAAIDNAGSTGIPENGRTKVAGKAPDVARRELTEKEIVGILRKEVDELDVGIAAAERHGGAERADELRARRAVLAAYVGA